ncbi:hypothetical protein [Acetobacter sp.]|uniref:hypothetical protein n=1 Tax=Acetobacter sp. TaxID=440 RepID=UPI0039E84F5A
MSAPSGFIPRLMIAGALAYPAGLLITVFLPRIFHGAAPDAFFVAQCEAIGIMPAVVLTVFAAGTLLRGLLAGAAIMAVALLITVPFVAFGAP